MRPMIRCSDHPIRSASVAERDPGVVIGGFVAAQHGSAGEEHFGENPDRGTRVFDTHVGDFVGHTEKRSSVVGCWSLAESRRSAVGGGCRLAFFSGSVHVISCRAALFYIPS